jgi:hypothetical protein
MGSRHVVPVVVSGEGPYLRIVADGRRDRADAEIVELEQFSERRRAQGAGRAACGDPRRGRTTKPSEPTGRGKRLGEQLVLAALIRRRTGARNARVPDRLGMGTEGNVTRAVCRVRTEGRLERRLRELKRMLEKRDPFHSPCQYKVGTRKV